MRMQIRSHNLGLAASINIAVGKSWSKVFVCFRSSTEIEICVVYRAVTKGSPEVWCIFSLLLLTTSAWLCLQHSRNLGTTFFAEPCGVVCRRYFLGGLKGRICVRTGVERQHLLQLLLAGVASDPNLSTGGALKRWIIVHFDR